MHRSASAEAPAQSRRSASSDPPAPSRPCRATFAELPAQCRLGRVNCAEPPTPFRFSDPHAPIPLHRATRTKPPAQSRPYRAARAEPPAPKPPALKPPAPKLPAPKPPVLSCLRRADYAEPPEPSRLRRAVCQRHMSQASHPVTRRASCTMRLTSVHTWWAGGGWVAGGAWACGMRADQRCRCWSRARYRSG